MSLLKYNLSKTNMEQSVESAHIYFANISDFFLEKKDLSENAVNLDMAI